MGGALLFFITSGYLIWNEGLFSHNSDRSGEVIAELLLHNKDVRHKSAGELNWSDVKHEEMLYQADSIFTGDDSHAAVRFTDGAKLYIDPKSLVTIRKKSGQTFLEVQSGTMSGVLSGQSKMVVVQGEKMHEITTTTANTRVSIQVKQTGQARLKVTQGEAVLPAPQGKTITLKENDVAQSMGDGVYQKVDISNEPPAEAEFSKADEVFEKEVAAIQQEPAKVDAKATPAASPERVPASTPVPQVTPEAPALPEPEKEIEVSSRQGEKLHNIVHFVFNSLIPSAEAVEKPLPRKKPLSPIILKWSKVDAAIEYELQMANDADFANVLSTVKVKETDYRFRTYSPGTFFWRVRGLADQGRVGTWSTTGKLTIWAAPPQSKISTYFSYEKLPNQTKPPVVTLRWKTSTWAKSYEVQTSKDSKFDKILAEHKTSKTKQAVQFPSDGLYFWRIRNLGESEIPIGKFSKSYRLRLLGVDPAEKLRRKPASIEPSSVLEAHHDGKSDWTFSVGTGMTLLSYEESNAQSFSMVAITPKVSASYTIVPDSWTVGANAFTNAMVLTSSNPNEAVQLLGANVRIGRTTHLLPNPWTLSIYGGGYYTTVLSSKSGSIGFANMMGPQFFPTLSYTLGSGKVIASYLKFSPIITSPSGFIAPSFKCSELATGVSLLFPKGQFNAFSVSLDFSRLALNVNDLFFIQSMSYTLGVAYSL